MDRPGGHGPSDARSNRAGDTVAVADMVMQRSKGSALKVWIILFAYDTIF